MPHSVPASLLLRPQARVLTLTGRGDAGGEHNAMLRVGLGVAAARTKEALELALAEALDLITAEDAKGWFQHRSYLL